jgi:hypothetical protein
MVDLLAMKVIKVKANDATSNAYCTIMTQAVIIAKANLDCQKRITHRVVETRACYVTHSAIEDKWNNALQLEKV